MNYFLILGLTLFFYMTFWFIVSLILKRNDVADIGWGLGFVLLSLVAFFISEKSGNRAILVNFLVTLWGIRLATHVYLRNKGKEEDYRYKKWRKDWGKWFYLRSYLQVYLLQGLFLFLISLPVLIINKNPGEIFNLLDLLGVLIWVIGFYFEVVGDHQLKEFIKNRKNKGKIMEEGLWKYTRHPNYFGEVLGWWGIWIIALSVPFGLWTIVGPIVITFLILKVSGIPMLEKRLEQKPGFEEYKKRVSKFIPLPPKD